MTICANKDSVQGLVDFTLDTKPYHTKIMEVLVEYIYTDPMNITITDSIHFDFNIELGSDSTEFVCNAGYSGTPYDAEPYGYPQDCPSFPAGFTEATFTDSIEFEYGSDLFFWDTINAYIEDFTDSGTYDTSGTGRLLAGGYGHTYGGLTDPIIFLETNQVLQDQLAIEFLENLYTPTEIIFAQGGGTTTTPTETAFTESLYIFTEDLILSDTVGVTTTEFVDPTVSPALLAGQFVGSWDYQGFDIGGYDEEFSV